MLGDPSVTRQRDVAVALRPSHRIFRVRQLHLPEIRLAKQSRSSSQRNQLRGWPVRWQRFPRVSARFLPWKENFGQNWSLKFWWKKLILFKSSYKYCQCFVKFFEMIPKLCFKSRFYFVIFVKIVIKKKRNWKKRLFDRVDEKKKQIRNRTIHISIR